MTYHFTDDGHLICPLHGARMEGRPAVVDNVPLTVWTCPTTQHEEYTAPRGEERGRDTQEEK